MKQIFLFFICALAVLTANAQFLFRISGGGLEKSSYILGTIHILPGTVLDSIPEYLEAEAQCQQLYAEIEPNKTKLNIIFGGVEGLNSREKLPEGRTIFDVLSKEQIDTLKSMMGREMMAVLDALTELKARSGEEQKRQINKADINTIIEGIIKRMENCMPISFVDFFSVLLVAESLSRSIEKDIMNDQLIDVVCISRAKTRGMAIGELDDISDLKDLFGEQKRLSLEEQVDSLARYLNTFEQQRQKILDVANYTKQIIGFWKNADFDSFSKMDYLLIVAEQDPTNDKKRNETWLPKMITAMHKAPTLFAFGSAHLIGPYSIIQKLRDAGYDVEQIKKN